jgi:hypothetical protein
MDTIYMDENCFFLFGLLVPFFFSYEGMNDNGLANIAWENDYNSLLFFTFVAFLPSDKQSRKITRICTGLMPVSVQVSCQYLYRSHASICTGLMPVSVQVFRSHASTCSGLMPVFVQVSCQYLHRSHASTCSSLIPVFVQVSCQYLFRSQASICTGLMPVLVQVSCQYLYRSHASILHLRAAIPDCTPINTYVLLYRTVLP